MNQDNHVSKAQMELLLRGEPQDAWLRGVTDHLDSCHQCQQTLDSMAAEPELWAKASKLSAEPSMSDATMHHLRSIEPNRDHVDHEIASVTDLLDEPSHPEMMGRLGNYDVEREVGRGGMGIVFKAFDTELNRPLAIKVLAPWLARNGTARQRFEREARAAAAVMHPNVISIYGVNANHKLPYLVMPYCSGPSLQSLVDEHGPLNEKDVCRIAMQVADGLAAAHAQGLVHRDVKPANILVESDVSRVLVTDFGLARAVDDASATQSGYFVGTPNYMSPEQALGQRVDARSDLFSLGSVIYFIASGHMPFRADSPICVLNRISNDEPTPMRQINSDISETLANVVDKLLEKDPDDRFQSAGDLHDVLEKYLAYLHQPDISKPPSVARRQPTTHRSRSNVWLRRMGIALLLFVMFVTVSAGLGSGWLRLPTLSPSASLDGDAPPKTVNQQSQRGALQNPNDNPATWGASNNADAEAASWEAGDDDTGNPLALGSGWDEPQPTSEASQLTIDATLGRPGELVTITKTFTGGMIDGYTIYLPRSYGETSDDYPVLMCLQGGNSVGGDFSQLNHGLYLLLNKSKDPRTDLPAFLQDSMIILSPHFKSGEYYGQSTAVGEILDEVLSNYRADDSRVYLSGISRGGTGVWGLAAAMPDTFAAVAPMAGSVEGIADESTLATLPIWVAHNRGDKMFDFREVDRVVSKLEELSGESFQRVNAKTTTKPDDLTDSKVFVIGDHSDHDAWSPVYNNYDFYQWLLRHHRSSNE